jgi:hypothetical protein
MTDTRDLDRTETDDPIGGQTGQTPGKTGGDTYGGITGQTGGSPGGTQGPDGDQPNPDQTPDGGPEPQRFPGEGEAGSSIGNRGPDPAEGEDRQTQPEPKAESPNAGQPEGEDQGTEHQTGY